MAAAGSLVQISGRTLQKALGYKEAEAAEECLSPLLWTAAKTSCLVADTPRARYRWASWPSLFFSLLSLVSTGFSAAMRPRTNEGGGEVDGFGIRKAWTSQCCCASDHSTASSSTEANSSKYLHHRHRRTIPVFLWWVFMCVYQIACLSSTATAGGACTSRQLNQRPTPTQRMPTKKPALSCANHKQGMKADTGSTGRRGVERRAQSARQASSATLTFSLLLYAVHIPHHRELPPRQA